MRFSLAAALIPVITAACSSGAAQGPDATVPDAGAAPADAAPADAAPADAAQPDPAPLPLERVDWRAERGAPLAALTTTLPIEAAVAVSTDGFVGRAACAPEAPCDYTWFDARSQPLHTRPGLLATHRSSVSPDGTRLALLEHERDEGCGQNELVPAAIGSYRLFDVATGASLLDLPGFRTSPWSPPAFLTDDWLSVWSLPDGDCLSIDVQYRGARAPFAVASSDYVDVALPGGRFSGWRRHDFGIIEDLRPGGAFKSLGESPSAALASPAGWVHATFGYAFNVYEIRTVTPGGQRRDTAVDPYGDWLGLGAVSSDRWVRLCRNSRDPSLATNDCLVVDTLGVYPPSQATLRAPVHALLAGKANLFLYVGLVDGKAVLLRRNLVAGTTQVVAGADELTMELAGDADAALVKSGNRALLVEAAGTTELAGDAIQVYTMASERGFWPLPQNRLVFVVTGDGLSAPSLRLLDLPTRRLVTVTDHLHHAPRLGRELLEDDCGQPAFVRAAGEALEQLRQPAHSFFFTEAATTTQPATVWVAPLDLGAPPRRLATLAGNPVTCHPPLASPDGARFVLVDTADPAAPAVTVATRP